MGNRPQPRPEGFLGTSEVAELLGQSRNAVTRLARRGSIPGAWQAPNGGPWWIPAGWVRARHHEMTHVPAGYISCGAAARRSGLPQTWLARMCKDGRVQGAVQEKFGRREWLVPVNWTWK